MIDVIVVGGGIVGLATAWQILQQRPALKIAILEKEQVVSKHQTGNNSGVIHSGIYYKPGSLKAKNCIEGYHQMIQFCQQNQIPFDLCGKVIVATDQSELTALDNIYKRGLENGLKDLKILSKEALKEHEPHVNGIKGIFVPQTGIVNYKVVSEKLAALFRAEGGDIHFGEKVVDIKEKTRHIEVISQSRTYKCKLMINCAGLYSDKIARKTNKNLPLKIIPFRGEYYQLKADKEYLVKNLIYPVPNPNFPFLGVHFTRMMKGGVEAGPNAVLAYKREGYSKRNFSFSEFTESVFWPGFMKVAFKYWKVGFGELYRSYSKTAFTKALQKLIPEIQKDDLVPGGAGVRAQACDRTGGLIDDFMIVEKKGIIDVCNAPSPAATSSLSIGKSIATLALKQL